MIYSFRLYKNEVGQSHEFQNQIQTGTSEKIEGFGLRFQLVTLNWELGYLIIYNACTWGSLCPWCYFNSGEYQPVQHLLPFDCSFTAVAKRIVLSVQLLAHKCRH